MSLHRNAKLGLAPPTSQHETNSLGFRLQTGGFPACGPRVR